MNQSGVKQCLSNDSDLLKALLGHFGNEINVDHVVSHIIENFGGVHGLLSASREDLLSLDGIPANLVDFLLNLTIAFNQTLNEELEVNVQNEYPSRKRTSGETH